MMLSPNEYEMEHTVTYYECDPQGQLTIGMLINLALLVSEEQSKQVGVSSDVVQSFGGGWVITNYEIEINDLPNVGEEIVLGTRATSYNKYFALREFWITGQNGIKYATIKSMFVYMDLTSRKMTKIPSKILSQFQSEEVKRIPRVQAPESIEDQAELIEQRYHVRYFDIDANQHVNNAHYFDWILDVLGDEFLRTHELTKMVIKYELEVRYGSDVISEAIIADDMTQHRIGTDGQLNAEANCWWKKRA